MGIPVRFPSLRRRSRGRAAPAPASVSMAVADGSSPPAPLEVSAASTAAKEAGPKLKPAIDVLAGGLARAASQTTIHPLDTIKVRMQAPAGKWAPPAFKGVSKGRGVVRGATSHAVAAGRNFLGLYRGVAGAASGAGIAIGAYFAFYGAACNALTTYTDMGTSGVAFWGGALGAVGGSVVKVPLAVCIRSVQAGVYPSAIHAARDIVSQTGARGLFTGFVPTLIEDVPDMAVKFAAYETMRSAYARFTGREVGKTSVKDDLLMGGLAGAIAAGATTPLDVIKTHMMTTAASRPTMMSASRAILATGGGAGAFFAGVGPRAVSNGINSAVFFCFFEAIRNALRETSAQREKERALEASALLGSSQRRRRTRAGEEGRAVMVSAAAEEQVGWGEGNGGVRPAGPIGRGVHRLQHAALSLAIKPGQ